MSRAPKCRFCKAQHFGNCNDLQTVTLNRNAVGPRAGQVGYGEAKGLLFPVGDPGPNPFERGGRGKRVYATDADRQKAYRDRQRG